MTNALVDSLVADLATALDPERVRADPLEVALYARDASVIEGRAADGNKTAIQVVPGLRQWGYLPTRQPDALSAPIHEIDAPGYQEPLKLYFEAVNKAQEKK